MSEFDDEYQRLRLIGRGSFASVYKVRHRTLGYVRAVKISNGLVDDVNDKAYRTFLNECGLLLKIGNGCHPNIVHIYAPRLMDNHAIVEMDYVDGLTLADYIKDNGAVTMDEFWRFVDEIVSALAYCHADLYRFLMDPAVDELDRDPDDATKFVISADREKELQKKYCVNHNDLHSNNIMRRHYDGAFVLLDFGLAIQAGDCVKSSSRGDGAYEYCSPEKLDGKDITSRSDVYSLGILLYELLTGRVPFVMPDNVGRERAGFMVYQAHLQEIPEDIEPLRKADFELRHPYKQYQPDMPDGLADVIMRCLAKKPTERYCDAKQLLNALLEVRVRSVTASDPEVEILKRRIAELEWELACRKAAVETSGESHIKIVACSQRELSWLRQVYEPDLQLMEYDSRVWYEANCFIIPPGAHLPTLAQAQALASKGTISGRIWLADGDFIKPQAYDADVNQLVQQNVTEDKCQFIAIS